MDKNEHIPYGKQYIDDDDLKAVNRVLQADFLTTGPTVSEFEQKLCDLTGASYAVAISNGTAALHAACYAAGIKKGDEVITTPMTFAASANCILYCGGTPVFADIDPETWNIDPQEIKKRITKKTKAVIVVDFTGQVVEMDRIRVICKKHHLTLIEDAAHSIGSKYKKVSVGNLADMTTFSFHPVKTITCGEGGAILTNNKELYSKCLLFRSHTITRDAELLTDNPYYGYNEQIDLGYNYRLTDIQAALGLSQLNKLDLFIKRRKEIVQKYDRAFEQMPELILQKEIPESDSARHLYIIRLNPKYTIVDRSVFMDELSKLNIGTQVHYMPVYYHPYYQKLGYPRGLCPKAEALYEEIVSIPLYYSMSDEDVEHVISSIKKVLQFS
ncbi:UDP-4-amino-4,6-dideoxy-N-acetyl-beta-L-altrosamine transaminase [Acetobacterium malicum]|uniref:UDP-4-amino-4, 6-dideoxy-N-acetyl-beta-L-altrosamine transaminase n=1 Tax=Acetobacterium malicum TaxID=52692 RepID=A0ABR6YV28_9FIRM|nr:UDP-4-amino-4,6-dideoxy-N-acetyl-beta-L-altrosamine transaminase [Acetobacterium malicum]MBC3899060.1 UDP-4-amino-4,6-dideoxy-N-acetyl-beta-L-altrosamine transaminase [Acetobacterium malicum]